MVLLACVAGYAFVTWRRHKRRQSARSAGSASDLEAGQKAATDDSAHPGKVNIQMAGVVEHCCHHEVAP